MKRNILNTLLAVLIVCALMFTLVACNPSIGDGGNNGGNNGGNSGENNGGGGEGEDPNEEGEGFTVTFVCDANVTVYVYKTQDMSGDGEEADTAYSRDGDTGELLNDGNGQVNFKLVFANGYKLKDMDITEGYNNLKGSSGTGVQNGFRITKITDDLTVTITSELESAQEDLTQGYKITFVCDSHVSVIVYKTQDMTTGGEKTNTAYSRESGTGTLTKDGGQVNFVLEFDEGYEFASISATPDAYKNIKYSSEIGVENGFRITQITGELTVTITSQKEGTAEGYMITFQCSEHVKIIVYKTQKDTEGEETNIAYSRDGDSGVLLNNGEGQINFRIVCDEGWEVTLTKENISGTFKNLKQDEDDPSLFRITKISSVLTITITATPISTGA